MEKLERGGFEYQGQEGVQRKSGVGEPTKKGNGVEYPGRGAVDGGRSWSR